MTHVINAYKHNFVSIYVVDLLILVMIASLSPGQSYACPGAGEVVK